MALGLVFVSAVPDLTMIQSEWTSDRFGRVLCCAGLSRNLAL